MEVLILTEGGGKYGFGHVARCSAVYEAFKTRNITPRFIVNGDESVKSILENDYEINDWVNELPDINKYDIVIIDSYIANGKLYGEISDNTKLTVCFDDNNRLKYPQGIVINALLNAEELNYPKNPKIKYLLGSEFSPLRSIFWDLNGTNINEDLNTVLITTGGNDLRNLTPKLLSFLDTNFSNLTKKAIITNESDIDNDCAELIISPSPEELVNTMLSADLAISSCGQTLYELACLSVPTIGIGIIENQKENIENFQKIGFMEYAGCWNDENLLDNISEKINTLKSPVIRERKKSNGMEVINRKGSLNIVKNILKEYYIENSIFRRIKESDSLKIYEIANDEEVRKNSFNQEKIDLTAHQKWFKDILNNNTVEFYVLEFEEEIIGQIRFEYDEKYPTVSISLNKKYRGLGLSKHLLNKGMEYILDSDKIIAYIKPENIKSISFFKSMGFKFDSNVLIKNCEALKFVRG